MIDAEIVRIIGLIYDAVIDPDGWGPALQAIMNRHGWINSTLTIVGMPHQTAILEFGINTDGINEVETLGQDVISMWGGPERWARFPLEEPLRQSEQTDPATWVNYKVVTEWTIPRGIDDQIGMVLAKDRTTYAGLGMAKHKSMTIEPWMIAELRLLAPHLRRAATISRVLESRAAQAATFEAALDAAQAGAVLVRGDLEIVHANASADQMLKDSSPIRASNGRLGLTGELVPGHLEAAVAAAAHGAAALGRRGIGIPARREDGSPMVVHVMPLENRRGLRTDADAAIFVADTGGAEPVAADMLALLFGLTPAESRVLELLAAGQSSKDAAREMGVAISTLRSHLLRVYDKTGRHSRAGLVELVKDLKLPR